MLRGAPSAKPTAPFRPVTPPAKTPAPTLRPAVPNANNGNAPAPGLARLPLRSRLRSPAALFLYNYLNQALADGAFIHTNSWDDKSTSAYTQLSVDLDRFIWETKTTWRSSDPTTPAPSARWIPRKTRVVVNATLHPPSQGSFRPESCTSIDGRRKPDLMAPGRTSSRRRAAPPAAPRTDTGTSFAAPSVAGAAALVRQYFTEGWYPTGTRQPHHAFTPSGALLKAALLNATVDAAGIAGYPGAAATGEGWGRLLLEDGLFFAGDPRNLAVWDVRHAAGLETGEQAHAFAVQVDGSGQPLKITLVWNEPPGAANSPAPVVNDLDLEVRRPDGVVLRGNVFALGESTSGGAADPLNNVEQVLLAAPAAGGLWITVRAGTTGVHRRGPQGYGLVATGGPGRAAAADRLPERPGDPHRDPRRARRLAAVPGDRGDPADRSRRLRQPRSATASGHPGPRLCRGPALAAAARATSTAASIR